MGRRSATVDRTVLPEGKATPYTKESMKEQLVMMIKFSGGTDCA